jgi:hypothetical protein
VTINYRLSIFGNLYLPELVKEDPNYPTGIGLKSDSIIERDKASRALRGCAEITLSTL